MSKGDEFFREDAERLGYFEEGGGGFAKYYRDHGLEVPGKGFSGRAHSDREITLDPGTIELIVAANTDIFARSPNSTGGRRSGRVKPASATYPCGHRKVADEGSCPKNCQESQRGQFGPLGRNWTPDRRSTHGRQTRSKATAIGEYSGRDRE